VPARLAGAGETVFARRCDATQALPNGVRVSIESAHG